MSRTRSGESTVVYDALGPRGRRRVLVSTVVVVLLLAGAAVFLLRRVASHGQLESPRWSYVTDPAVLRGLALGMVNNLRAAAIAGVVTLVLGLFLALGRLSSNRLVSVPTVAWIEFFRGFPLILLIIFPALLIPHYFHDIDVLWYVVLGLVLYNSAVMAEIYRAGILSLDRGQREAAYAVGLTNGQAMRLVILPQAVRRMVPLILTQLIILFKDSTLGEVVSYPDALRRGETLGSFEPRVVFQAILVTALMFFVVSFTLSRLVALVERRQSRRPGGASVPAAARLIDLEQTGVV
jgi:glutamate transport system permease protein